MTVDFMFVLNSILFGVGLAMDAFSVSLADGLSEPHMGRRKLFGIAVTFAFFQGLMPLLGWVCVHTVVQWFSALRVVIPWVSLVLLSVIGGKMLYGALRRDCAEGDCPSHALGLGALCLQGVATSIDALSVGFTIATYAVWHAVLCALIIAAV
ncbi:MAG: manganese efflux pump, partial [Clostridia bacterium]|nr:manganese efflux pump [Clostridia bacterium]